VYFPAKEGETEWFLPLFSILPSFFYFFTGKADGAKAMRGNAKTNIPA
jgi:hypothetical protein